MDGKLKVSSIAILLVVGLLLILLLWQQKYRPLLHQIADNQSTNDNIINPVKVGLILGLTGPVSSMNSKFQQGAQLAVELSNSQSALKLKLFFEDNSWEARNTVTAYRKLRNMENIEFFFVAGTSHSLALRRLTETSGVMLFSWGAGNEIIHNSSLILRHSNLAENDAFILAQALQRQNVKSVAIISIQNDWASSFNLTFKKQLKKLSIKVLTELEHLPTENDFKPILLKLRTNQPQALVVNSFGAATAQLILQTRNLGILQPIFANNGLALSTDAIELLKDRSISDLWVQHYLLPPSNFDQIFFNRFGEHSDAFSLTSFCDMELLIAAIKSVGSHPTAVVSHIKRLGKFSCQHQDLAISATGEMVVQTKVSPFADWIDSLK